MARFLDNPEFINECRKQNRKVDLKVWIDWFGDGEFEEIKSATDEVLKLNLSRELEGDIGQAILDQGTLVLDNSNNDYSPKSVASRFNRPIGENYEFNLIPNRSVMIDLSVNGSEYVHYYSGIITNIEPNYDNSRVSITIEDEMLGLENFSAPDKLYIEENAREVIRDLLEPSPIDFDEELIDEFDYQITYNFLQEGSVFNALRLIAEMVWAKFYVIEDKLRFINFKELDQSEKEIIEIIKDERFLDNGYGETYSSQDLYTSVELDSNPLKYTSDDLQMVWTGSEKQSRVTEEYLGSDISGTKLQLTSSDGAIEQPTNNVPIAENSLTVSFGDRTYITNFGMTSGIKDVNWDKGIVYFKDTGEFPMPSTNQTVTINYSYFILTIPPRKEDGTPYEKEIIAEFENPSTNIQDIDEYIKFQATDLDYDISYASYGITLNRTRLGGAGSTNTVTKQLSSNASTVQVSGYLTHYEKDYKYPGNHGTDYGYANSRAYLIVNDENVGQIGRHAGGRGGSHFRSSKIPVPAGAKIKIRHTFDGDGEKSNKSQMYNVRVTVGETIIDEVTQDIQNVRVEQYNFPDNRKTRLIFINDSDTEVSVYSTYQGEDVDNIYLLGRPLKRTNPIHVEKTNDDANQAFSYMGKTLSIQNDLFQSQGRMQETVDFLLDYYSTPRSRISIPIRGLGHIDLMDKVHVQRKESDIDNYFLINTIEEEFTEEGEWNQTLELVQAKSSAWQYDSEGFNTIVSKPESPNIDVTPSAPPVDNLTIEELTWKNRDGSYNVNIEVSYNLPPYAFFDRVAIYLSEGGEEYDYVGQSDNNSYRIRGLRIGESYQVRAVLINQNNRQSNSVISNRITTTGNIGRPPAPDNFKVSQLNDSAIFRWDEVPTKGIAGYEIRRGNSWEDSILVNTELKSNRYREDLNYNGTYQYMIKTIDNAGQYSINYSQYVTTFRDIESDINILLEYDEIDNLNGTGDGFASINGELVLANTVTFNDIPNDTFNTIGDTLSLSSFPEYNDILVYETEPVDTFKVGRTGIRLDYNIQSIDQFASFNSYPDRTFNDYPYDTFNFVTQITDYSIEMALSNDGSTWSDWEDYLEGQYEFRYIKFRLSVKVESKTLNWKVQKFNQIIDVPDKILIIEDLSVSNTGTSINFNNYNKDFYTKPQKYWASVMSNGQFTYPVFSNVDSEGLTIELIDSNNNNVNGLVNLYVEGY